MLCFVVVMQSFIMNSYEVFIHIHQGCFAGTGAIVRLPQCQWSEPDGYGKIGQCITTTKHSKAKTVCIFLGIYCRLRFWTRPVPSYYVQLQFCLLIVSEIQVNGLDIRLVHKPYDLIASMAWISIVFHRKIWKWLYMHALFSISKNGP